MITGDFNFHVDDCSDKDAAKFKDLLLEFGLQQHVNVPTHRDGHTLDLFITRKYDRITPALVTLHWLPVKYRIEFKTLLIVFNGLHGKAPTYIQEMITPSKSKRYSIRSNEERVLKVPKFKHDTFGKRAFAVYGPLAWNCLPKEIRLCDEIEAFKRNLKTHLFVKFVNESTLAI